MKSSIKTLRWNDYSEDSALKNAVEALSTVNKESHILLPGRLLEVARKGKPAEIQFNQFRIRYFTKDEDGLFRLYWLVTNGISGRQKYFYSKDWIGKTGKMRWMNLAKAMRLV